MLNQIIPGAPLLLEVISNNNREGIVVKPITVKDRFKIWLMKRKGHLLKEDYCQQFLEVTE